MTTDDDAALAAVTAHHAGMHRRLEKLTEALIHAVASGDTVGEHEAHAVLVEWCEDELLPHALAEEDALYAGAAALPEGTLLVDGMLAEHRVIVGLLEELRAVHGVAAAVVAGALQRVFSLHLDKENRLLLPLIAATPGLSLARSAAGLHELLGEAHGAT